MRDQPCQERADDLAPRAYSDRSHSPRRPRPHSATGPQICSPGSRASGGSRRITRNPTHVPEALSTTQTICALGRPHPGTQCCLYCSRVQHGPGEPQHPRMSKRDLRRRSPSRAETGPKDDAPGAPCLGRCSPRRPRSAPDRSTNDITEQCFQRKSALHVHGIALPLSSIVEKVIPPGFQNLW